jgi:hypothetical protein
MGGGAQWPGSGEWCRRLALSAPQERLDGRLRRLPSDARSTAKSGATDLPWAMSFPIETVPTLQEMHPTPLYEALAAFAFGALL